MANQIELRAAAARLFYDDNRNADDYYKLINFIDSTFRDGEGQKAKPLTQTELRNMNDQIVYCLELNTEVRVSARKVGWITVHYPVPNEKDCCNANTVTLYRTKPEEG